MTFISDILISSHVLSRKETGTGTPENLLLRLADLYKSGLEKLATEKAERDMKIAEKQSVEAREKARIEKERIDREIRLDLKAVNLVRHIVALVIADAESGLDRSIVEIMHSKDDHINPDYEHEDVIPLIMRKLSGMGLEARYLFRQEYDAQDQKLACCIKIIVSGWAGIESQRS